MDAKDNNDIDFLMRTFDVPPRYKDISWECLSRITPKERKQADDYVACFPHNEKESIYLSNKRSGTGKTSFAICLARDLITSGKVRTTPFFVSFRVLMEHMRQDNESFLQNEVFQRIMRASFVIFDDVGVERVTASVADRYIMLLEQLWLRKIPAIFTSKFTIYEFLNRGSGVADKEILESIGSRLVGMCDEWQLKNEEDYRANG